jgi:hypothetical protein
MNYLSESHIFGSYGDLKKRQYANKKVGKSDESVHDRISRVYSDFCIRGYAVFFYAQYPQTH